MSTSIIEFPYFGNSYNDSSETLRTGPDNVILWIWNMKGGGCNFSYETEYPSFVFYTLPTKSLIQYGHSTL